MSLRLEFVQLASQPEANLRQLCRRYGISPTAGYKWLTRFKQGGVAALVDQSRRPHQSPARTERAVEAAIVAVRRAHPAWGARKLRRRLADLGRTDVPATSTVTDILRRHDLITAQASAAAQPFQRFERPQPNQLWQVDFKGHFALNQGRCYPLGVLDDHSRYNVLLAACADQQARTVQNHLIACFRRHGLPDQVLWDNGAPWGSGGTEPTTLDVWLMRLSVRASHGRPYHPQTQGKEERFHRTLQAEVLARGGWTNCAHVQSAFDHWRPIYNTQRPHDELDLATPLTRYRVSQRAYPETLPPVEYASGVTVRRVDGSGYFSYHGAVWRAGRAFAAQTVGVRPTENDGIHEVFFQTQVIKELDLRTLHSKPVLLT